ncbi:MAG: Hsp70 family protein, partial [Mycobacterium sp.]|nr:Hsp70 family protein [Mycobacterium sp.]
QAALSAPDAFEVSPKRRLADREVFLASAMVPVTKMVAAVFAEVLGKASGVMGGPPELVVITHPDQWSTPLQQLLIEGACAGGVDAARMRLVSEAQAAASFYATSAPSAVAVGARLVVFDFGAGTCDVAVLDKQSEHSFAVIASDGLDGLGGQDLDARIEAWVRRQVAISDPVLFAAITDAAAIANRLTLEEHIRGAKEALSEAATAAIVVTAGASTQVLQLTRDEFEELIGPDIDRAVQLTQRVMAQANERVPCAQTPTIYLTGGSSAIPLVHSRLAELGSVGVLGDPKTVVAQGALYTPQAQPAGATAASTTATPAAAAGAATAGPGVGWDRPPMQQPPTTAAATAGSGVGWDRPPGRPPAVTSPNPTRQWVVTGAGGPGSGDRYPTPPPRVDVDRSASRPPRWWRRRRNVVIAAIIALTVAAIGTTYFVTRPSKGLTFTQSVLPFTGLNQPALMKVDSTGTAYVVDFGNNRVVKLAAGSNTQTVLPFTGLNSPEDVAVDSAGTVDVADYDNNRVVQLAAGSNTQSALPFTGLNHPSGVALDSTGNIYVADYDNSRVVKLAAGTQTVLPFTGLDGPNGVAVDGAGTVYVADHGNNRVVKLAGGTQTVLPFTGLTGPNGVAVDGAGAVYVADLSNRVLKLAAGANTATVLPFTGLRGPAGVAVDSAGSVYVADFKNNQVVKLTVG